MISRQPKQRLASQRGTIPQVAFNVVGKRDGKKLAVVQSSPNRLGNG